MVCSNRSVQIGLFSFYLWIQTHNPFDADGRRLPATGDYHPRLATTPNTTYPIGTGSTMTIGSTSDEVNIYRQVCIKGREKMSLERYKVVNIIIVYTTN